MPFIGNQPALSYTSFAKQDFTTSATTSYVLDYPVTNANEIALFINFVRQEPTTAYTASGTSLTLTSATSASDDMYAIFLGKAVQTVNPPAGSVGASQIADGSIALGKLSATGTKDSTTFLRGDNTFQTVSSDYVKLASVSTDNTATSISLDGYFSSTYNNYILYVNNCYSSASDSQIYIRYRSSNADLTASSYRMNMGVLARNSAGNTLQSSIGGWDIDAGGRITADPLGDGVAEAGHGIFYLSNPLSTTSHKRLYGDFIYLRSSEADSIKTFLQMYYNATSALSGLTVYVSSGNITANLILYGIKH